MILLFVTFIVLLVIGVPIIFTLGISSLIYLLFNPIPLTIIPQKMVISLENFIFLCLPLFILTGEIMNAGGITLRLINLAKVFVGRFKGGLAYVNIVVSMLFGGVQGLASADTAAVGSMLIPGMVKDGYEPDFSTAVTVASSTIGPMIPPSFLFIIYAMVAQVSVGKLFLGGIIPGILLGGAQMVLVFFMGKGKKFRGKFPKGETLSFKQSMKFLLEGIPALGLPIIIIGGIVFGVFTVTEAAGIAVVYALIMSLLSRELKLTDIPRSLFRAAKLSGSVCLILSTATLFAWIVTAERIPYQISVLLLSITENKLFILLLLNVFLLFVGTFMDPTPSVMILTPIFMPLLINMGMDPVHIGVFMCFNLIIGLTTPPVGECLFIASSISKLSMERLSKAMIPFLIINIGVLLLITYFSPAVTFIPNLVMGR